jgi:hypothetical protein
MPDEPVEDEPPPPASGGGGKPHLAYSVSVILHEALQSNANVLPPQVHVAAGQSQVMRCVPLEHVYSSKVVQLEPPDDELLLEPPEVT